MKSEEEKDENFKDDVSILPETESVEENIAETPVEDGIRTKEPQKEQAPDFINKPEPDDEYVTVAISREERKKSFPTMIDMLAILGVVLLSVLFAALVMLTLQMTGMADGPMMAIVYVAQLLPPILFFKYFRKARKATGPAAKLAPSKFNPSLVLWGILLLLVMSVVIEPLLSLFPSRYLENFNDTIGRGGWTVLTTVVLAPILEEVFFRGQILGSIKHKYGSFWALLVSSLLFALIHGNPPQMVNAFFMGLILGYICLKTGSLLSVIVIHAFNNALAYIQLEAFGEDSATATVRQSIGNDAVYYIVYGISLALLVVGIIGMWRTVRRQKAAAALLPAAEIIKKDTAHGDNNIGQ